MRRPIIPYQIWLKKYARALRKKMTYSEVILWKRLKGKQLLGYDFDRQRPIGNFIVDFYCKDLKLAIEVDGITHMCELTRLRDEVRQQELEKFGVHFLRFDALLVINKPDSVVREIKEWIVKKRLLSATPRP